MEVLTPVLNGSLPSTGLTRDRDWQTTEDPTSPAVTLRLRCKRRRRTPPPDAGLVVRRPVGPGPGRQTSGGTPHARGGHH